MPQYLHVLCPVLIVVDYYCISYLHDVALVALFYCQDSLFNICLIVPEGTDPVIATHLPAHPVPRVLLMYLVSSGFSFKSTSSSSIILIDPV